MSQVLVSIRHNPQINFDSHSCRLFLHLIIILTTVIRCYQRDNFLSGEGAHMKGVRMSNLTILRI